MASLPGRWIMFVPLFALLLWPAGAGAVEVVPVAIFHEVTADWEQDRAHARDEMLIVAPRNGEASGQAVVVGNEPLSTVHVSVSVLVGPRGERIASDRIEVRYLSRDTLHAGDLRYFDTLLPEPRPAGRLQPFWVTVHTPTAHAPGRYRGRVVVETDQGRAEVPLQLDLASYVLPSGPRRFWPGFASLFQSPESVAGHYDVELWSDRHLELLRASFRQLAAVGDRHLATTVYLDPFYGTTGTIVFRQTPQGPEPDFRIFDRLLRLYREVAGEPAVLSVAVWGPGLHPRKAGEDEPAIPVSFIDEAGQRTTGELPYYTTAEGRAIWKRVLDGVAERLDAMGMTDTRLTIGVASDLHPPRDVVDVMLELAPRYTWYIWTHGRGDPPVKAGHVTIGDFRMGYYKSPFGPFRVPDATRQPIARGWDGDMPRVSTARMGFLRHDAVLENYRNLATATVDDAGRSDAGPGVGYFWSGFAGPGMDIWLPRRDVPLTGPGWPRMVTDNARAITAPGENGALATARFESIREGQQELQARITLERILTDPAMSRRLSRDLRERALAYLKASSDRRHRWNVRDRHPETNGLYWRSEPPTYDEIEQLYTFAGQAIHAARWNYAAEVTPDPRLPRTWMTAEGETFRASLQRLDHEDHLLLRERNGQSRRVALDSLAEFDRQLVRGWMALDLLP
ncbi:MAG: glycoside hydrolase domain-containing protein [Phycisphaeraceae bacterium]